MLWGNSKANKEELRAGRGYCLVFANFSAELKTKGGLQAHRVIRSAGGLGGQVPMGHCYHYPEIGAILF